GRGRGSGRSRQNQPRAGARGQAQGPGEIDHGVDRAGWARTGQEAALAAPFQGRSVYGSMRLALTLALCLPAAAQIIPGLEIPPSGNNQKASVTQQIGPVKITIDYSSPAVHGPDGKDRRGQI